MREDRPCNSKALNSTDRSCKGKQNSARCHLPPPHPGADSQVKGKRKPFPSHLTGYVSPKPLVRLGPQPSAPHPDRRKVFPHCPPKQLQTRAPGHGDDLPSVKPGPGLGRAVERAGPRRWGAPSVKEAEVQEVTELGEASGEVHVDWSEASPAASLGQPGGAGGTRPPSRSRFFCFMRRFWNQILTCVSLSSRVAAISTRRARLRYLLKWNSFSSSVSCRVVKLVRRPPGAPKPTSDTFARGGAEKGTSVLSPFSLPSLLRGQPCTPFAILSNFCSQKRSLGSPDTPHPQGVLQI